MVGSPNHLSRFASPISKALCGLFTRWINEVKVKDGGSVLLSEPGQGFSLFANFFIFFRRLSVDDTCYRSWVISALCSKNLKIKGSNIQQTPSRLDEKTITLADEMELSLLTPVFQMEYIYMFIFINLYKSHIALWNLNLFISFEVTALTLELSRVHFR